MSTSTTKAIELYERRIRIMNAYREGEIVQQRIKGNTAWIDQDESNPIWDWEGAEYQIAPRTIYVPESMIGNFSRPPSEGEDYATFEEVTE